MTYRIVILALVVGACGRAPTHLTQCRSDLQAIDGDGAGAQTIFAARMSAECRAFLDENSGPWQLRLVLRVDRPSTGKVERLSFSPAYDLPLTEISFNFGSTAKDFTFRDAGWLLPLDRLGDPAVVMDMPSGADSASMPLEVFIAMTLLTE